MTVRILRPLTGCVAAVSMALLVAGIALSYAYRHMGPLSRWDFSDVLEEATFIAVPLVGFILTSRRPGNRVGWILLGAGLALGLGFFCDRYGRVGLVAAPGSLVAGASAASGPPAARVARWATPERRPIAREVRREVLKTRSVALQARAQEAAVTPRTAAMA